jgi:hypothetical protein
MPASPAPEQALNSLAAQLRADETVISELVADCDERPSLGLLAAAGPRAVGDPASYALVVEAVREGYLLHYGEPRIVLGADRDLALLAGDYLYALGLERLAAIGDQEATRELADLISLSAQLHADGPADEATAEALWSASVLAIGAGSDRPFEEAKQGLRRGAGNATQALAAAGAQAAEKAGLGELFDEVSKAIHFPD